MSFLRYNETFHPQSQLAKYLGEKQNQALLQQIHVLSSSLNDQDLVRTTNSKDKILKEQIRFRFLEAIEHMKILSKVRKFLNQTIIYITQCHCDWE